MTLAAVMTGCGTSGKAPKDVGVVAAEAVATKPSWQSSLSTNDRLRLNYLFQEASKQKMLGNHVAAFDLLSHCLEISPEAPEVLYQMAIYRLFLRQDSLGLKDLRHAADTKKHWPPTS